MSPALDIPGIMCRRKKRRWKLRTMKTTNEAVEVAAGGFHDLGVIFSRDIMGNGKYHHNRPALGRFGFDGIFYLMIFGTAGQHR